MTNDVKIAKTNDGVSISINGDVKLSDVKKLTESCSNGGCDCNPEMLAKISDITTHGKDGNVNISLLSDKLNASEVQSCMSECDCGF